jgi:hypothetical protein
MDVRYDPMADQTDLVGGPDRDLVGGPDRLVGRPAGKLFLYTWAVTSVQCTLPQRFSHILLKPFVWPLFGL